MGDPPLLCEASKTDLCQQVKLRVLHLKQAGEGSEGEMGPPPAGVAHVDDLWAGTEVGLASVCRGLQQRPRREDVGLETSRNHERCSFLNPTVARDSFIAIQGAGTLPQEELKSRVLGVRDKNSACICSMPFEGLRKCFKFTLIFFPKEFKRSVCV